ncbi:MAG TPA: FAD-linked oxidase C-terminal domain-containing protein [Thermodesulfobacteriota bacterium]|nr:FAD-linked oxidase C-terminal domain-containing protein [Thermodesulfobacteriota bacterium]
MPDPNARTELEKELAGELECEIRFDRLSRILYSTDASNYQIEPVGVVVPRSAEDISKAVGCAAKYGIPILPRGGGTSLAGQAVGKALVLDFSKYLNKIIEIDAGAGTVRVEPGIYLENLNRGIAHTGLMFGPDPSTARIATAGGAIGNNSTGAHSILYGMAGDNVEAARVILPGGGEARLSAFTNGKASTQGGAEGELFSRLARIKKEFGGIIETEFPKHWRRASGYSLNYFLEEPFNPARLLAGSEGTLGIASELTLKLVPRPKHTRLAVLEFGSVVPAMEAVTPILMRGPSAVELIDSMIIGLARKLPGLGRRLTFTGEDPEALLVVEFYGETEDEAEKKTRGLAAFLRQKQIDCAVRYADTPGEQADVWAIRRAGLGILLSRRGDYKPIPCIEDVSVPAARLAEYVADVTELIGRFSTKAGFYGHASAGCLHVRPLVNLKTGGGVTAMKELMDGAFGLAVKYGGVMSGEHGDGLQRSYLNERLFGPGLYRAMRELKEAFDPRGLMNPGKVVGPAPPDEDLRFGEGYRPYEIRTYLDWSSDEGFAGAAEMCSGQGVCRKLGEGIMCPSYMATRDERDTTRARANALRAVLSGRAGKEFLTGSEMRETFDLCISCKACKSECPSAVDAAKMKSELLAHYHDVHGLPLRDRLFGNIHALSRAAAVFPALSNAVMGSGAGRSILSRIGISGERTLPALSGESFTEWFRKRPRKARVTHAGKVLYFHDTWVSYYQPEIGKAAVRLLEAAGFEVILAERRVCCGRPMISKGMLREAKRSARANAELLAGYAREGIPVVGTEPSCMLTFRDEYPDLLPGNGAAALLSKNSYLLDEFLFGEGADIMSVIKWKPGKKNVLYHGHCHQRALIGMGAPVGLLKTAGCGVTETNAGCCGMAGSFGYESEHYAVSRAIGEDRLFPAVRNAPDDTVIAISGVSCLHQIEHFTGRRVKHVAEVLADRLDEED